ncbi:MAG: hypothetical protein U0531_11665 [Dehalococcoidia bacterium]
MREFDGEVGLGRLVTVHANDCKAGLGSGLDRHENIGQGHLGEETASAPSSLTPPSSGRPSS